MTHLPPFHLAFQVNDLEAARRFYGEIIGCTEGRSDSHWIDFDFFGHQIVAHLDDNAGSNAVSNPVDGHDVPVPHFGAVLEWDAFHALKARLEAAGIQWVLEPYLRFEGEPGEQATMFVRDPSGNALEFKAFRDPDQLFATD
ncbi:glyoxalase [Parasphingopyxis sp. CP4]|uniref:VOC family protein n=1 Tax=Parasphingopyxis sp. CP4 TaxID=2724527 RepID=UPI0015A28138|nr:VOC family protein [Parasphingopyxis sp. CP4]QLC22239.1 glyoxalase [Parasphingopyxis sp. CP4]